MLTGEIVASHFITRFQSAQKTVKGLGSDSGILFDLGCGFAGIAQTLDIVSMVLELLTNGLKHSGLPGAGIPLDTNDSILA